jgi:deoxyribose-phosphate aldolase
MNNRDMDKLIDAITERVAGRLAEMGAGTLPPKDSATHCSHGDESCHSCGQCVVKKSTAVNNILNLGASRIGASSGINSQIDREMASKIDHTLLKPDASRDELQKICDEAREFSFATVCVNSSNIPFVARQLKGSGVKPIAVVGFPLGAGTPQAKAFEAKEAIRNGAEEIDMVINIGAIKSKEYRTAYNDICSVVEASKPYKVKVILETSNLNNEEKIVACALSKTAGAAFVKTSTGFGKGGATIEDIELMRKIVGDDMEVKASGGIRTKEDADAMVHAGANRIGASASIAIVTGKKAKTGTY